MRARSLTMSQSLTFAEAISPSMLLDTSRQMTTSTSFGLAAGSVEKQILGGRILRVVVVVAALGVGLPDVDDRVRERFFCIQPPDSALDEHHLAGFQGRSDLRPKRGVFAVIWAENVILGRLAAV